MTAYWLMFDLHVEGKPDPLPTLQVTDAAGVLDPLLRAAVIEHVQPRWPGAPLQVRIGHQTMRGRILAGRPGSELRPVATFRIAEQTELDLAPATACAQS